MYWLDLGVGNRTISFEYAPCEDEYSAAKRVISNNDLPKDAAPAIAAWIFRKTGGEARIRYKVITPPTSPTVLQKRSNLPSTDIQDSAMTDLVEFEDWLEVEVCNVDVSEPNSVSSTSETIALSTGSQHHLIDTQEPQSSKTPHRLANSKARRRSKVGKRQNSEKIKASTSEEENSVVEAINSKV